MRLLDQMGHDLGVGGRGEGVPGGDELRPQLGVVLDDPVVDEGDAAGAVDMGMGVLGGGAAVGGPAGVADGGGMARGRPSSVSSASAATELVPPAARARQTPRRPPWRPRPSRSPGTRAGARAPRSRGTASASPVTPMMPHMVDQATRAPRGSTRSSPSAEPSTMPASSAATASAWASARASTITRTSGSVPLGRSRTRPSWPSSASALTTASHTSAQSARRSGCGMGTLTSRWGTRSTSPSERSARERPARSTRSASAMPVRMPSPVVERVAEDDVARLLAAQAEPVRVERGQHVAVADVGLADADAAVLHGQAEAQVGHDGHDDRVAGQLPRLGQVEGEQGQEHVAVDHAPGVVDGDDAVGVAVESQPEVGAAAHDRRRQLAGSVEPHRSLMLAPSGASCRAVTTRRARPAPRGDLAGRAVGAVDHDAQAVEGAALGGREQVLAVDLDRLGVGDDPAHAVAGGPTGRAVGVGHDARPSRARSSPSTRRAASVPTRLNSLMPLSPKGLCEAETTAPGALRRSATAATPGVGSTPRSTTSAPSVASPAERAAWSRGPERRVSRPTTKVGAGRIRAVARPRASASSAVSSSFATPRTPSVPKRAGATSLATAWSTAAPCGPSSGRTSWTPSPGRRG